MEAHRKTTRDVMCGSMKGTGGIGLGHCAPRAHRSASNGNTPHPRIGSDPVHMHTIDLFPGAVSQVAALCSARSASTWRTGTSTSSRISTFGRTPGLLHCRTFRTAKQRSDSDEFMKLQFRRQLVPRSARSAGSQRKCKISKRVLGEVQRVARPRPEMHMFKKITAQVSSSVDPSSPSRPPATRGCAGKHTINNRALNNNTGPSLQPLHRDHPSAGSAQRLGLQPGC
jgi:hypothetical protein